jgi:hypothetical protein
MKEKIRDYRVYYVRCPEDSAHFILLDSADPRWEKTPPKSPGKTHCYLCGEEYQVNVIQPWKIGYVSSEERDNGWTLTEPPSARSYEESSSDIP